MQNYLPVALQIERDLHGYNVDMWIECTRASRAALCCAALRLFRAVCLSVCLSVCMYVCTYVRMYVCVCVHVTSCL